MLVSSFRPLALASVLLASSAPAGAALVLYTFDSADPGTLQPAAHMPTPFSQTVSGVRTDFSGQNEYPSNPAYSLQNNSTGALPRHAPLFDGNYTYPGNYPGPFYMRFAQPVDSISFSFATADLGQNEDGTWLELIAYTGDIGSAEVGRTSGNAPYSNWTEGTLSLSTATPFRSVMLHLLPQQPPASYPPSPDFFVDNIQINVVPEPAVALLAVTPVILRRRRANRIGPTME